MASVYRRKNGKFAIRYRNEHGTWVSKVTAARTKAEATRLAHEAERRCERIRLGLEAAPGEASAWTMQELMDWWLDKHSVHMRSHDTNTGMVANHVAGSDLAATVVARVQKGELFQHLRGLRGVLSPKSINNLRGMFSSAFEAARDAGLLTRANPVKEVRPLKVPKTVAEILNPDEAAAMLHALGDDWRPLFATALYQALRKGELFALRKTDVDLVARRMTIRFSHDRDTTKGGHADVIPIADACIPYLAEAIHTSPSELVFPTADGSRRSRDTKLCDVLRRALGRAGVVTGYELRCRRQGCGHKIPSQTNEPKDCPRCGFRLWPVPKPRKVKFHELRHTTASLLIMAGASPAAVQKILRHADIRITMDTYTHFADGFLHDEIDRLRLPSPTPPSGPSATLATTVLPSPPSDSGPERKTPRGPFQPEFEWRARKDLNLRPSGSKPDALSD